MKRSEAVKTIGRVIVYGVDGFSKSDKEKYEKMSLADIILTELEKAGMIPPIKQGALSENFRENYIDPVAYWEEENPPELQSALDKIDEFPSDWFGEEE